MKKEKNSSIPAKELNLLDTVFGEVNILALDLSLEHTGWAYYDAETSQEETGLIEPGGKIKGMERLQYIRSQVMELTKDRNCLVLVEGYAFGAKGSSGISLGELGGVIRLALYGAGIFYLEVPPTVLKKFLTGKGISPKEIILKEVFRKWNFDTDNNNIADAYTLMMLGRSLVRKYPIPLLAPQREVLEDITKTYFKNHPVLKQAA